MTKRVMAFLAAMGIVFLLAAYAQKLHSPQQLAVYDADGKKVGVVVGAEYYGSDQFVPLVPFKVEEVPFMLMVYRDGFVGYKFVGWESTDCSGTAFLLLGNPGHGSGRSPMPLVGVGVPGDTVYVEDGQPRYISVRSFSTVPTVGPDDPPPLPTHCTQAAVVPYTRMGVPARPLIDMNAEFRPPFTVR